MKDLSHVAAVGGLLSRDLVNRVNAGDATLPGADPTDYDLVPGERVGDSVARSWNRLVGVWANFRKAEAHRPEQDRTATAVTRDRWLKPLLEELDFHGLSRIDALPAGDTDYPISHQWKDSVPVHLLGWRVPIDSRTKGVPGAARKSPHSLMQEFLNRSEQHLWGIVTNGRVLRVLRDNASLTRQAYCEFDLEAIFDGNVYSDFQTLWRICHRTRFEGDPPAACILEKWNIEAITSGTRALEQLRQGVEKALEELGTGFLDNPASTQLRHDLRTGTLTHRNLLRQLLRLVYRMLFLLVAENRELLLSPDADQATRQRYGNYYSMSRLRRLAEVRRTLHKRLFGEVWHWAGTFRLTEKNVGIAPVQISFQLRNLLDDVQYWVDFETYEPTEAAARFHHRLVYIHPFPNGNGRHARIMADAVLEKLYDVDRIDWEGAYDLGDMNDRRDQYISALRAADGGDYGPLFEFVGYE